MNKIFSMFLTSILFVSLYALPGCADQSNEHPGGSSDQAHDSAPEQSSHHSSGGDGDGDGHSDGHGDGHSDGNGEAGHAHDNASFSVGKPATEAEADRTISVVMSDAMTYTFTPNLDSIENNEVIKFVVSNGGKINHEFSVGNQEDQIEHAAMMAKMPNMTHDDPNTVTVKPGESKTLVWRFQGEDLVVFACNIPGHYQAGMFKKAAIESTDSHNADGHSH